MSQPAATPAPALKEIFNRARLEHIADEAHAVYPDFDRSAFLESACRGLEERSLMDRLQHVSDSLQPLLPAEFDHAQRLLRALAPRLNNRLVTLILPAFVARHGSEQFDLAMDALKFFTPFGSSEFAVRHFLRRDPARTLSHMHTWAKDPDEHVRRLASEGSRPRLPWSFHIEPFVADPSIAFELLEILKTDSSAYVRKSVANHLNDITKDHPDWALERVGRWDLGHAHTAWIARHGLRTLIKRGDRQALTLMGAGADPEVAIDAFDISPQAVRLGQTLTMSFTIRSLIESPQRLVIDYAIHYVKRTGATAAKVFKLKTLTLPPLSALSASRRQAIRDFSTRIHYPGVHAVELMVNGHCLARGEFDLLP